MACQIIDWAIQCFGGAGTNNDYFLAVAYAMARLLRLADGPDEVHCNQIGKWELKRHRATDPELRGAGLRFSTCRRLRVLLLRRHGGSIVGTSLEHHNCDVPPPQCHAALSRLAPDSTGTSRPTGLELDYQCLAVMDHSLRAGR
jgi:hypothetical protein